MLQRMREDILDEVDRRFVRFQISPRKRDEWLGVCQHRRLEGGCVEPRPPAGARDAADDLPSANSGRSRLARMDW